MIRWEYHKYSVLTYRFSAVIYNIISCVYTCGSRGGGGPGGPDPPFWKSLIFFFMWQRKYNTSQEEEGHLDPLFRFFTYVSHKRRRNWFLFLITILTSFQMFMHRSSGGTGVPDPPPSRFLEVGSMDPTFVKSHQGPAQGSFSTIFSSRFCPALTLHQNFAELVKSIG